MKSQKNLEVLLSEADIQRRVQELAEEISNDMAGQDPVLIGGRKGAVICRVDRVREFELPVALSLRRTSATSTTAGIPTFTFPR